MALKNPGTKKTEQKGKHVMYVAHGWWVQRVIPSNVRWWKCQNIIIMKMGY
jgi:hypothetical protein